MTDYLQTQRLSLRQFAADEASLFIELDSDPAVMRYLTGGAPSAPDQVFREQILPGIRTGYDARTPGARDTRRRAAEPCCTKTSELGGFRYEITREQWERA